MFVGKEELISHILNNDNFKGCFIVESEEKDKMTAGVCLFIDKRWQ